MLKAFNIKIKTNPTTPLNKLWPHGCAPLHTANAKLAHAQGRCIGSLSHDITNDVTNVTFCPK